MLDGEQRARADVVVVSYNSRGRLRRCVRPLTCADGYEVIVVDNASTDGCIDEIRDLPLHVVELDHNGGFAHGCNVGWRAGTSPHVLFLNPDAVIAPSSLATLVATLAADSSIGAAAPLIVEPDGSVDRSQRRFPRLRSTYAEALFLHRIFRRAAWATEMVRDAAAYDCEGSPEWVSGACMLVRREVLKQLGGWDESFFLYSEDKDLCKRIRDAGFDIRFVPTARAVHEGGASTPRTSLTPVLAASRLRYARKHSGRVRAELERLGIALGALTHIVVTSGGRAGRLGHAAALGVALGRDPRRPPVLDAAT